MLMSWMRFDQGMAKAVKSFVLWFHEQDQSFDLVSHCTSGISRSAAIALWAQGATNAAMPRQAAAEQANSLVLNMLNSLSGEKHLWT